MNLLVLLMVVLGGILFFQDDKIAEFLKLSLQGLFAIQAAGISLIILGILIAGLFTTFLGSWIVGIPIILFSGWLAFESTDVLKDKWHMISNVLAAEKEEQEEYSS